MPGRVPLCRVGYHSAVQWVLQGCTVPYSGSYRGVQCRTVGNSAVQWETVPYSGKLCRTVGNCAPDPYHGYPVPHARPPPHPLPRVPHHPVPTSMHRRHHRTADTVPTTTSRKDENDEINALGVLQKTTVLV